MIVWLLAVATTASLLSTVRLRAAAHWPIAAVSIAAEVWALVALPSADGDYWLVLMALSAALGLNAFGCLMLLARGHPRRLHRHIVYGGYGLVFTVIALCWAVVARHPDSQRELGAGIASLVAYAVGSVAILVLKQKWTARTVAMSEPGSR